MTGPGRVDVHAHFVPDVYRAALEAAGLGQPDGMPQLPEWDDARHLEVMDRLDIEIALLSISSPGVHLGEGHDAASLARAVNEAGHHVVRAHPHRFGLLASLPLPDVEASLRELHHVFDRLTGNGVALLTHSGGTYLGDPSLEPVFAELDRRHARLLIHPTSPPCWEQTSLGRPRPMIEFLFDTTRCVVDLVLNGTVARHPNIRFIAPHAGAALSVIADRVAAFAMVLTDIYPRADVLADLGRLHYDVAGFPLPRQLDALLALTTVEHLHYGSDYPFTPDAVAASLAAQLDRHTRTERSLTATLTANTRMLFPNLDARA